MYFSVTFLVGPDSSATDSLSKRYKLSRAGRRSVGDYLDPADSIPADRPTYEPLYVHYLSALRY